MEEREGGRESLCYYIVQHQSSTVKPTQLTRAGVHRLYYYTPGYVHQDPPPTSPLVLELKVEKKDLKIFSDEN